MSIFDEIGGVINSTINLLQNAISSAENSGASFVASNQPYFQNVINSAGSAVSALGSAVDHIAQPAIDQIKSSLSNVLANFSNSTLNPIFSGITGELNNILGSASQIPQNIFASLQPIFNNITNGVDTLGTNIRTDLGSATSNITDMLASTAAKAAGQLSNAYSGLTDVFNATARTVNDTVQALSNSMVTEFGNISSTVSQGIAGAAQIIAPYISELEKGLLSIPTNLSSIAGDIISALNSNTQKTTTRQLPGEIDLSPVLASIVRIIFD